MKFEGKVFKDHEDEKYYSVVIEELGVYTQGKTLKECYEMAKDAIEMVVDKKGFSVEIFPAGKGIFYFVPNNINFVLAKMLMVMRANSEMTVKEIIFTLGEKSETGYRRYEQGKTKISVEKFAELSSVFNKEPILKMA